MQAGLSVRLPRAAPRLERLDLNGIMSSLAFCHIVQPPIL